MRLLWSILFVAMIAHGFSSRRVRSPLSLHHLSRPTSGLILSAHTSDDHHPLLTKQAQQKQAQQKQPFALFLFVSILTTTTTGILGIHPQSAHASAPVMAVPVQEMPDPEKMALHRVTQQLERQERAEMEAYNAKARLVEQTHGEDARDEFERDYKLAKQAAADLKAEGLRNLRLSLLEQGICPWVDPEGYRQVFMYRTGEDLAKVPGTKYFGNLQFEIRNDKRAFSVDKEPNREMIRLIVQDCKNKDLDLLEYFEQHQDKTAQILEYPRIIALQKLQLFQNNIKLYGEPSVPKTGTLSLLEQQAADPGREARLEQEAATKAKAAEVQAKTEAEQAKVAAKIAAKEAAKTAKEQVKAERAAQQADQKRIKDAIKAAAQAAAAAATMAAAEATLVAPRVDSTIPVGVGVMSTESFIESTGIDSESIQEQNEEKNAVLDPVTKPTKTASAIGLSIKKLPIIPATAFLMAAGGGTFMMSKAREQTAAAEKERQRQFKLIMGIPEDEKKDKKKKVKVAPSFDLDNLDDDPPPIAERKSTAKAAPNPNTPSVSDTIPEIPKKKKGGIRSMFAKKSGNNRETDLSVLVASDATAPEFVALLAKLLSFGAPGRFPQVDLLPGPMPVEEFDLEEAQSLLVDAVEDAGLSKEDAAEVFANVVNCMLIDIVDLASAALKEDAKVTFDAINVVIEFMNNAASLYDAVAQDVIISPPVTYGGDLAKSKLEQMYGSYAFSAMLKMDEVGTDDRIDLLRSVFDINEKKAEGIVMKATQKNMMEMMKNPEGMEDLEKLMGGMLGGEGMEGLEGLLGGGENGEGPNLAQLKEMLTQLKIMKDAGTIPPEELRTVRQQFKESFGSSIDEIMSQAKNDKDGMTDADRELLVLMQDILED